MANIELIIGPMFSGKTTELLRRCRTYKSIDKSVHLINHTFDTRCKNEIKTHDNFTYSAQKTKNLCHLEIPNNIDVIAIDEVQFFDDLIEFIKQQESSNIIILLAGLSGDSNRKTFGQVCECIPFCNTITKLSAMCSICKDGTLASFSKKICSSSTQIDVGASDKYIAVCRTHYITPSI